MSLEPALKLAGMQLLQIAKHEQVQIRTLLLNHQNVDPKLTNG